MRFSLATAGALIGSSLAAVVYTLTGQNFILTFTAAAIPPAFALIWVFSNFQDDLAQQVSKTQAKSIPNNHFLDTNENLAAEITESKEEEEMKLSLWEKAKAIAFSFKPAYWQALLVILTLYFARFDASFLLLRAKQVPILTHMEPTQKSLLVCR